jgi:WhiB family transcriptional regulator, redox-sensing transcriptional regulator
MSTRPRTGTHLVTYTSVRQSAAADIAEAFALAVTRAMQSRAWQGQALCAQTDPEAFFPEKGGSSREAKRTCMACDVRSQCLEYALERREPHGIWGGLSGRQRNIVLRSRAEQNQAVA